ncbi:MAG TPA: hypothetical protein VNL18_06580 [Gemmatimonadales bacterium]|nr:hypothetical protein [Gemmatimonadales bacterium]
MGGAASMGGVGGCRQAPPANGEPAPTAALPTAGLAGQKVVIFPLTLVATDEALDWGEAVGPRRAALDRADSALAESLKERAPEVTWVGPDELRRAARRGTGVFTDPDQMATALLRSPSLRQIPDPLWSQMRTLTATTGDRYVMVPAALVFVPGSAEPGRAELTVVLADVRTGAIGWRTVARGEGVDPWAALRRAVRALTPGLP